MTSPPQPALGCSRHSVSATLAWFAWAQSYPARPAGYPDMGVFAPAGTPKDIVTVLHREIVKIIALPDIRERLPTLGFEPVASTPEEFAARIKVEVETWGKVIRAANIKVQ